MGSSAGARVKRGPANAGGVEPLAGMILSRNGVASLEQHLKYANDKLRKLGRPRPGASSTLCGLLAYTFFLVFCGLYMFFLTRPDYGYVFF